MTVRLLTANTIRNAALEIIDHVGIDRITTARTRGGIIRIPTKSATVDGLKISYRELPYGRDLLEIWDGPKVFNVQGDANSLLSIVSFRRGPWERKLYTPASEAINAAFTAAGWRSSAVSELIEMFGERFDHASRLKQR